MQERLLQDFINCVNGMCLKVENVIVIQNGEIIDQKHWVEDKPKDQYSVTKSITSTAIGMAIDEGLLSIKDKVVDFFPEEVNENTSEEMKYLTLHHLMTMTTGHNKALLMRDSRFNLNERNWIHHFFSETIYSRPGERFLYSNGASYIAGIMLQRAAKQNLVDFLMPRLFEPLNIARPKWEECYMGYTFGGGGLEISTEELSRFGKLYIQNGIWEGKQLVSKKWIQTATRKQTSTPYPGQWSYGYGYHFWICSDDAYRADGRFGQFCIVIPKKNAVITINSKEERTSLILEKVWSHIVAKL